MREFEAWRGAEDTQEAADAAPFDARMAELEAGKPGTILHLGDDLGPRKRAPRHLDMQSFHHPAVQRQDP